MSFDPFENLPEDIKKVIKDMMNRLQNVNPEDLENIENMMEQLLGPDIYDKFRDMMESGSMGNFSFSLDPTALNNFENFMSNFAPNSNVAKNVDPEAFEEEIEPLYAEINEIDDNSGEVVVEIVGATDLRQVNWEFNDKELVIIANIDGHERSTTLELPQGTKLNDAFADLRNSIFILPFKKP